MAKKKIKISVGHTLNLEDHTGLVIPGKMATPTLTTTNFTLINACDSVTDWDLAIGSGPGGGLNTDIVKTGTGSISRRADNGDKGYGYDLGVGNELDFSDTGANYLDSIFFWVNILQPDLINSMRLRLSSSTTDPALDWIEYRVFPDNPYEGGWYRAVVNPAVGGRSGRGQFNQFASSGSDNLSSIRWVAFMFDMGNVGGTSENVLIDEIRIGTGLIITGGTTGDRFGWQEIADVDSTNGYGVVQQRSGVFFITGGLQFGNGTADCWFEDTTGAVVVWEPKLKFGEERDGVNAVLPGNWQDFNAVTFDEGTGTVDFTCGAKVGTGDDATGINGTTFIAAESGESFPNWLTLDFSGAITDIGLYGCTFQNIIGDQFTDDAFSIIMSSDATDGPNHEVMGCNFSGCSTVDVGRADARNNNYINNQGYGGYRNFSAVWGWNNVDTTWTDETTDTGDKGYDDVEPFVSGNNNTDDAIYFGMPCPWSALDSTQGQDTTFATFVVEYWDGDTWSSVGTVTTVVGNINDINGIFTWVVPTDWVPVSVNGSEELYYARLRTTSSFGSQVPEPSWSYMQGLPAYTGAIKNNVNSDVVNCNFIANASAVASENGCGIDEPATGVEGYTGLVFTGNDFDVLLTEAPDEVAVYDFSNQDDDQRVGNGTIVGIGQSFAGTATDLSRATFYLKKVLSPTGTLTANLYAHSGTFGTSSVPTGAALATSETLDVSTLTTSYVRTELRFTDDFTMSAATNYVIVLEYSGGDATNYVDCAMDSSSPTHGGNSSEDTGSWAANSGEDLIFWINSGTLVITASGGTDATTIFECGINTVVINNLVDVTLTDLQTNTEVRVYETGTIIEIDGVENSGTSFTFQADASAFVDIVIHHIEWVPIFLENFDIPLTDTSIPIQQQFDRVYSNP